MKGHLFLAASRPGSLNRRAPQDDPAWAYLESERAALKCKKPPTREERLLRAHRIAAEVCKRRGWIVERRNK